MRAELMTLRADGRRRVALRILHLEIELPSTSVPFNSATLNIAGSRDACLYSSESCRERPSKLRCRATAFFEG
jgi:hypothetical protein